MAWVTALLGNIGGKGYATEAAKVMVHYGFERMQLDAIYAIADKENEDSRKVLEKIGMECTGEFLYDKLPHYWFELHKTK